METFNFTAYLVVLLFTIVFPLYLSGRVWFAFSPFVINYYHSEKQNWYNNWNKDRFIIVFSVFIISVLLSVFLGSKILLEIQQSKINFIDILFFILAHIICLILLELKMDHPFRPVTAFKEFRRKNFDDRFKFIERPTVEENIQIYSTDIKREVLNSSNQITDELTKQQTLLFENNSVVKENNKLLQHSDFTFEFKNNAKIIIADVMKEFFIDSESEKALFDFLLRQKKTEKIIFDKPAKNGVSVQPVFDFFTKYTNLIETCKNNGNLTQVETIKIINDIVLVKDRKRNVVENPISSKNFSKYLS